MTLGSHQRCVGKSQTHLTPKWLIDALGPFDLDPCAADPRPWDCAKVNYTESYYSSDWRGMVWLNPPFNRYEVGDWIRKLAVHGNGICLVHARTEATWFRPIWEHASLILFLSRRIKFCRQDGTEQPANSGAPPVLAAFGNEARLRLGRSGLAGAYVHGGQRLAHCPQGHEYTPDNIYSRPNSARRNCRTCARLASALAYQRLTGGGAASNKCAPHNQ